MSEFYAGPFSCTCGEPECRSHLYIDGDLLLLENGHSTRLLRLNLDANTAVALSAALREWLLHKAGGAS